MDRSAFPQISRARAAGAAVRPAPFSAPGVMRGLLFVVLLLAWSPRPGFAGGAVPGGTVPGGTVPGGTAAGGALPFEKIAEPIQRLIGGQTLAPVEKSAVRLDDQGRLLCWITLTSDAAEFAPSGGMVVEGRLGCHAQALVPVGEITSLAARPEVLRIAFPPRAFPLSAPSGTAVQSEALGRMRAPTFWTRGGEAKEVRVGIIDVGFSGYTRLLGSELPSTVHVRSFYRNSQGQLDIGGEGEVHGAACAEIVHDVAPQADLYLANVLSPVDLANATDWMVSQGVEVISHSVGWFWGPGDGTGDTEDIALSAHNRGVFWVNAAGNFGESHWEGLWHDQNGNGTAEIGAQDQEMMRLPRVTPGRMVWIVLLWNRWPSSPDLQLEVRLVGGDGSLIASSEDDPTQRSDIHAVRSVGFTPTTARDDVSVEVRFISGDASLLGQAKLRLYRGDNQVFLPVDQMPQGSIAMPADAPAVIAVGAYDWQSGALEAFSSRGPNEAGLPKPDLLGPDGVSTATYGAGSFYGTSAACPHVAGVVALLLGSAPRGGLFDVRWSTEEVLRLLRENAEPMPDTLADASGWGRVRLPSLVPAAARARLVLSGEKGAGLHLRLVGTGGERLQVFDVLGRLRATLDGNRTGPEEVQFRLEEMNGRHMETGRYWAREPVSEARASFFWTGAGVSVR